MMKFLCALALCSAVVAWQPSRSITPRQAARFHTSVRPWTVLQAGLEEIDVSDPFDSYEKGQSTMAIKDVVIGEGEPAANGDVVTVSFLGTIYPSGVKFAENEGFAFELGEGKTMPGFDKGLLGVKVGGKRTLRVPSSLAFGSRGSPEGRIPPNADLQYECEILNIATGDFEKAITKFGKERLLGIVASFAFLALSSFLPK